MRSSICIAANGFRIQYRPGKKRSYHRRKHQKETGDEHRVEELEVIRVGNRHHSTQKQEEDKARHQGELALIPPPPVKLFVKPGFKLHPSLREQEDQDYEKQYIQYSNPQQLEPLLFLPLYQINPNSGVGFVHTPSKDGYELFCVGIPIWREDVPSVKIVHQPSIFHDHDAIAHLMKGGKVMGDEKIG